MADVPLSWKLGIDNVSNKSNLPQGAVADAVNVDIDRAGTLARRAGYAQVLGGSAHDLWTSPARSESFAAIGGALCRVRMPWASTSLHPLAVDVPLSYDDLNGDVVCGSKHETLVIAPDLSVRRLGLEVPGAPGVVPAASGGMTAGAYGVAISYLCGNEEGGLSSITFADLTEGQGFALTLPQPAESLPTAIRIYRTQANGDVLYRVTDLPLSITSYLLGLTPVGRQASNWGLERMMPGDFVRAWKGRLWTVRGRTIYFSEPLRYGLYSPRHNFVQAANPVTLFEPVEAGIFVGGRDGIHFISGTNPKDFNPVKLGGQAPIRGTGTRLLSALLGDDGDSGQYVALWLAGNGFVIGRSDGSIVEKQRRRITLSGAAGAVAVHGRQVTAVVS